MSIDRRLQELENRLADYLTGYYDDTLYYVIRDWAYEQDDEITQEELKHLVGCKIKVTK